MSTLTNKIDFAAILTVQKANPNGDPLNGNRPRTDYEGYGEISDVCLKRKLRNRLMQQGEGILIQSDDNKVDDATSVKARIDKVAKDLLKPNKKDEFVQFACQTWFDVRAFGQVFAYKGAGADKGLSIALRGPVTLHSAFSIEPVATESVQITKSVNNEDKEGKSSDTMGMKHRINKGVYLLKGSINPQLAQKTGFSDTDAETIKKWLPSLFENDESSARPAGSMEVTKVFWWNHGCAAGKHSSAKVHGSLVVAPDGSYTLNNLTGLEPEVIDGF